MTKHVFLSFVAEDLNHVNLFRGQAKNKKSDLQFDDYSVREPYNSLNADYIRSRITERIRAASVTICLIGTQTGRSRWVDWEINKSYELGNKVFGVRLEHPFFVSVPVALKQHNAKILDWQIDAIVRELG